MHTTTVRLAQSLEILNDRMPLRWRSRLRSILSSCWIKRNEESESDSLCRLANRLLADVGLYYEHGIHDPRDRTDQQQEPPVPAALLAMWMPRI